MGRFQGRGLWLVLVVWLALTGGGLGVLRAYENRPSQDGVSAERWPAGASTTLDEVRPTLVLFAHPRCPCTRATFEELTWIMSRARGRLAVRVFFYRPSNAEPGWEKTSLWKTAESLGALVAADPDGAEARRFGALTSGMALVYAPNGRALYRGGITPARGHIGENPGRRAVMGILASRKALESGPVFGCALSAAKARMEDSWKRAL